jgi:hypothetical protein
MFAAVQQEGHVSPGGARSQELQDAIPLMVSICWPIPFTTMVLVWNFHLNPHWHYLYVTNIPAFFRGEGA